MRVFAPNLTLPDAWVYPAVAQALGKPYGSISYRFRVAISGGKETKVTVLGDNILRITDNVTTVLWTLYDSQGKFQTLATSDIKVGSGQWTNVTIIYSPTSISLLEDGRYKYTRQYPTANASWTGTFSIQHLDKGTAVSIDLSNVRCLPFAMSLPPPATYHIRNFKFSTSYMNLSILTGPIVGYPLSSPTTSNQLVRLRLSLERRY